MRRFYYIAVLVFLYLVFTAKSCDDRQQAGENNVQDDLKNSQDSILVPFEPDTLSAGALAAFETAAMIRFRDFGDYLAIFRDTSLAKAFREMAGEMIRGMFISENSGLMIKNPGGSGNISVTLSELLAPGSGFAKQFGRIRTDSVRIRKPLERVGDSGYAGELGYLATPVVKEPLAALHPPPVPGTVRFVLQKHRKIFGTDTLRIWEVFLGN